MPTKRPTRRKPGQVMNLPSIDPAAEQAVSAGATGAAATTGPIPVAPNPPADGTAGAAEKSPRVRAKAEMNLPVISVSPEEVPADDFDVDAPGNSDTGRFTLIGPDGSARKIKIGSSDAAAAQSDAKTAARPSAGGKKRPSVAGRRPTKREVRPAKPAPAPTPAPAPAPAGSSPTVTGPIHDEAARWGESDRFRSGVVFEPSMAGGQDAPPFREYVDVGRGYGQGTGRMGSVGRDDVSNRERDYVRRPSARVDVQSGDDSARRMAERSAAFGGGLSLKPLIVALVVIAAIAGGAFFAWHQLWRYDDTKDIQGQWLTADGDMIIVITDEEIAFPSHVTWSYTMQQRGHTMHFDFAEMEGDATYSFSRDRNTLTITQHVGEQTAETVLTRVSDDADASPELLSGAGASTSDSDSEGDGGDDADGGADSGDGDDSGDSDADSDSDDGGDE